MNAVMRRKWFEAARDGDIATVRKLLARGADVNAANGDDCTALHEAAQCGHAELVALLVEAGADVNASGVGGWTPLHMAAAFACDKAVKVLVIAGADIEARDAEWRTPREACQSFKGTFDRLVAEALAERVRTAANVRAATRRPRL